MGAVTRRLLPAAALAAALAAAPWGPARAQVDPRGPLRTLATAHLRVHYPPALESLARRTAAVGERAWAQLAAELTPPSAPVDLLLADNVDASNGYAQLFPTNRVVVYAVPPVASPELRHHGDWLTLVVTHELAHIFHLDRSRGVMALGRRLFGRAPPFFPNALLPSWVKEGIAMHYETRLTGSGRLASTAYPMVARAAARDGALPTIPQLSAVTSRFPLGQARYAFGAPLLAEAEAAARAATAGGREGGGMRRYVEATAARLPLLLDGGAARGFGTPFGPLFDRWRDSLRAAAAALDTTGDAAWRRLAADGFYAEAPRWADDSTVVWSASNGREVPGLYQAGTGGGAPRRVGWRNTLAVNVPVGRGADGAVRTVFTQGEWRDPYVWRSDLYVAEGRRERRLTRGARLTQADVRADGGVVAVQLDAAATRLVRVPPDGAAIAPLAAAAPGVWAEPRWAPDGARLAAVQLFPDGVQRLVVLDTLGQLLHVAAGGRGVFAAPAFTPDGRRLVWTSDRSGRMQLETAPLPAPGTPGDTVGWRTGGAPVRQASRVSTGLFAPAISPDGRQVAALWYGADGYHVVVGPLDTAGPPAVGDWYARPRPIPVPPGGPWTPDTLTARRYAPGRQLWPRYWLPVVGTARDGRTTVGASSSGSDITARHAWSASWALQPARREVEAFATWRYAGFGVPVVDATVQQQWDATFRAVDAQGRALGEVARRRQFATLAGSWSVPRMRRALGASLGAQLERRDFTATADAALGAPGSLLRRGTRYPSLFGSLGVGTARGGARRVSAEEGGAASVTTSYRWRSDAPGTTGSWRTLATARGFRPLGRSPFARPVLAVRAAVGVADQRSATEFQAGGVSGTPEALLPGLLVGDPPRAFAVRGVPPGTQRGTRAVGGTLEYRMPLALLPRPPMLLGVTGDRVAVTAFTDVARAWCPAGMAATAPARAAEVCPAPGTAPVGGAGALWSVGGELVLDLAVAFDAPLRLRLGAAAALQAPGALRGRGAGFVTVGGNF